MSQSFADSISSSIKRTHLSARAERQKDANGVSLLSGSAGHGSATTELGASWATALWLTWLEGTAAKGASLTLEQPYLNLWLRSSRLL